MGNSLQSASITELNDTPEIPKKIGVRFPLILLNLVIYLFAFALAYLIKKQAIVYDQNYASYLLIYISAWAVGGLFSGKFRFRTYMSFGACLSKCYISLLFSLGIVAFYLSETASLSISRLFVVGSLFLAFTIEVGYYSLKSRRTISKSVRRKRNISYITIILDLILLTWVLFFMYDKKIDYTNFNENQAILLAGTFISWLLAGSITHQFEVYSKDTNIWNAISVQLKFYLLFIALMSFIVYILQINDYYRMIYLTAIIIFSAWSFILMFFLYIHKLPEKTDDVTTDFLHAFEIKVPELKRNRGTEYSGKYSVNTYKTERHTVSERLENIYLKKSPAIFSFLAKNLNLDSFELEKVSVLSSRDPSNITVFPPEYLELFFNLHALNDLRRINEYFIDVNERLRDGGIYAGNFEPIRYRYERFRNKYPFILANTFYLFDFLWKRAAPKLPFIKKIYFAITNGTDRALSLAEGLGRLYFCGFEILDLRVIDSKCFFIAKKVGEPSTDQNPSFSPLIKMKRHGKNGKEIFVYKLRTMHPFSEYLQEFVYTYNNLDEGGKFRDDFRITKWGAFLRKHWLDELPMIINFLKRDLKLVGVRPLSRQYLSLYDTEFAQRRMKYKPGLIPPYYADMPKTINEIMASEKKYLDEYDKHKFRTDVKYFFKSVNNIVFKKERSK